MHVSLLYFTSMVFLLMGQVVRKSLAGCTMLNKEQSVQVSDTTGDDSSNDAKFKEKIICIF